MQVELSTSLRENLIGLLQECRQKKNLQHAKRLHAYMQQCQIDLHPVLGNFLVPMLAACGSLSDAQYVFDRLPHRTEHSWNSLISGYCDHGQPQYAFQLYYKMQENIAQPNRHTYLALLSLCARLEDVESGREMHAETVKRGLEKELHLGSTLVDMYCKCGALAEAHEVFEGLPIQNAVSWTALIAGFTEHGLGQEALNCFRQIRLNGVYADAVLLILCFRACGTAKALEIGQEVHAEVVNRGLEMDLHLGSTLVDMYGKCGLFAEAQLLFDGLPVRDIISWTALIAAYAEQGSSEKVLNCFKQMQSEGVSGDALMYLIFLKACGTTGRVETGHELHAEIRKLRLLEDLSVANMLIEMYSKCGSFAEAQEVFDQLPAPDRVSFNALITGYAELGLSEEVERFLTQMPLKGIAPNLVTFALCLRACSLKADLQTGRKMHAEVMKRGWDCDLDVGNALVVLYGNCGSLVEAQHIFVRLPVKNEVSWTGLVAGYAEHGPDDEVLKCSHKMQLEGLCPDAFIYLCNLKTCGITGALETGREMHAEIIQRGFEGEFPVGNMLVEMYTRCGFHGDACQVFDRLPVRNAVSWTAKLSGYVECGLRGQVLNCLEQMQVEGLTVEAVMFVRGIKASGANGTLEIGEVLHAEATKRGLEIDLYVGSVLVDMYCKCGSVEDACKVFSRLPVKDVVSWTALISGYAERGFSVEVLNCFKQMQLEGVPADAGIFALCLKACGATQALESSKFLHTEATKRGLERELIVGSTLVDLYGKCGSLVEAQRVFDRLPVRNAVSWTTLISGYSECGHNEEVLDYFRQMQLEGVPADAVTYSLCLKACGVTGALETGREIHAEIRKSKFGRDTAIGNMLIDMYGKCGSVEEGQEVFDNLPSRDVISWTAMVKAYGENHEGSKAVQCFEKMQRQGVKPNSTTFTCLLAACSHASLVLEGQKYFSLMREEHEVEPTLDHYACMVDLLARSGHVLEAQGFISAMQCPPSSFALTALLSACKIYGKMKYAERYFQQLVESNQEDSATYLLMSDMYACFGRWSDANRIEQMRKHAGASKLPGNASIEVNKVLHEFIVGASQNKYMSENLELLSLRVKDEGYIPGLDLVSGI